ncbi:MAG: 4Fe-4S dicluster domain-containing protein [Gammaproteobacteria bacterium]|nr:4Fe-4S dicluster domain-containing protein [Gammaproteobacteria bacterium]
MSEMRPTDQSRREFLGGSAKLAAGITLAPGIMLYGVAEARPASEPASSTQRWGMLIDSSKCATDCNACVTGCQNENGWGPQSEDEVHSNALQKAQWIRKVELRNTATGHVQSLPMMCQHCDNPPCVDVCPTGASMKRADGIVLVDKHICIGCRYCMMACPYKARSFVHEALHNQREHAPRGKGTVEACTLCVHKLDAGEGTTACAEACNAEGHKAILVGDLRDANSEISQAVAKHATTQVRADLGLNPGVRYRGI